jgi:hypothetical protein
MFSGAAIASSTKPVLIATGLITLANPVMTNKFNQSRCDEYNGLLIFFFLLRWRKTPNATIPCSNRWLQCIWLHAEYILNIKFR